MKSPSIIFCALSLALLSACGGGGDKPVDPASYATTLSYQNPDSTGFRLVKNATASSTSRLVLDLVGPSGTQAKGVALFLVTDGAKAAWVHPTGAAGSCVAPGSVFPLGAAPQLKADKVEGAQVQVGLFQKGGSAVTLTDASLLSLGLNLKGATVAKGAVSLGSGKQAMVLNGDGTLSPITISLGTLSAQ
jgi:hypothetical protein